MLRLFVCINTIKYLKLSKYNEKFVIYEITSLIKLHYIQIVVHVLYGYVILILYRECLYLK